MGRVYCEIRDGRGGMGRGREFKYPSKYNGCHVVCYPIKYAYTYMRNLGGGGEKGCSPPQGLGNLPPKGRGGILFFVLIFSLDRKFRIKKSPPKIIFKYFQPLSTHIGTF